MEIDDIKHTLRKLKRLEIRLRFNGERPKRASLIWDSFFDLGNAQKNRAKFRLSDLALMNRDEYKNAVNEYLSFLFQKIYGASFMPDHDIAAFISMDLPCHADKNQIKSRFRKLAKLYHPDTGGDSCKFNELMEAYRNLMKK